MKKIVLFVFLIFLTVSVFSLTISSSFGIISNNKFNSNFDILLNISKFTPNYIISFSFGKKYIINNKIQSYNLFLINTGLNSQNSSLMFSIGISNIFNNKYHPIAGITSLYHFKYMYLQVSLLSNIIFQNSQYYFTYPNILINTGVSYNF